MTSEEKRKFHRIAYQTPGQIKCADKPAIDVKVADLSIHGGLLYTQAPIDLKVGTPCVVTISLSPKEQINFEAKVIRVSSAQAQNQVAIGVQCTSIGLDDITTLKNIVTMNSADPSLLNRELAELIR